MKFAIIHPLGWQTEPHCQTPDLWTPLISELQARGHSMSSLGEADIVLFNLAVWEISPGSWTKYNEDDLLTILKGGKKVAFFDHSDHQEVTRFGDITYGYWPGADWERFSPMLKYEWARLLNAVIELVCCTWIYFLRKMHASKPYPEQVIPLEWPMLDVYPLATKEELFARPEDICFLGNLNTPIRQKAIDGLFADGRLKMHAMHVEPDNRYGPEAWLSHHRQCKMFIEIDAQSLGSERPLRLMTVAPMLRVKSDHLLPSPRKDLIHQVEIGKEDGTISEQDIDKVLSVLNDKELLYSIYYRGALHSLDNYSSGPRARYIADNIERAFQ